MKRNKRGSIELSFGTIFSIILIIVFVAVAFYAIRAFLNFQNDVKIAQFGDNLQKDVEDLWKGDYGSYNKEYSLPAKIRAVCFFKQQEGLENLKFVSDERIDEKIINYIDIQETVRGDNEACFENKNGKVSMILKKDFGENLVTIQ